MIVGSGLTEMTLVPAYLDDGVFHDYASCRLGRMYCASPARRLSIPMFWTPDAVSYLVQSVRQVAVAGIDRTKQSGSQIALVCATDTDLLRESGSQAMAILRSAGAVETHRVEYEDVVAIFYDFAK